MVKATGQLADLIIDHLKTSTGLPFHFEGADVLVDSGLRVPTLVSLRLPIAEIPIALVPFDSSLAQVGPTFQLFVSALPKGMSAIAYGEKLPEWALAPLEQAGIGYADLTGKAYFPLRLSPRQNQPLIWQAKFDSSLREVTRGKREQLIFALLANPSLRFLSHRAIAREIDIPHSTVNHALISLAKDGDIALVGSQVLIHQPAKMLDQWLNFFAANSAALTQPEAFRSSLMSSIAPQWWTSVTNGDLMWSGDVAASMLEINLRPARYLLYYAGQARQDLMRSLRLVPDPRGPIELRRQFWRFKSQSVPMGLAPLPLVYADLMLTEDSRATAAAALVKERILIDANDQNR